jgi:hypothetical protein
MSMSGTMYAVLHLSRNFLSLFNRAVSASVKENPTHANNQHPRQHKTLSSTSTYCLQLQVASLCALYVESGTNSACSLVVLQIFFSFFALSSLILSYGHRSHNLKSSRFITTVQRWKQKEVRGCVELLSLLRCCCLCERSRSYTQWSWWSSVHFGCARSVHSSFLALRTSRSHSHSYPWRIVLARFSGWWNSLSVSCPLLPCWQCLRQLLMNR